VESAWSLQGQVGDYKVQAFWPDDAGNCSGIVINCEGEYDPEWCRKVNIHQRILKQKAVSH
jgi:hypothetical protein